jgi:hypothetical protein
MTHANLYLNKKEVLVTVKITIEGLEKVYGKTFSCIELCLLHKKTSKYEAYFYNTSITRNSERKLLLRKQSMYTHYKQGALLVQ